MSHICFVTGLYSRYDPVIFYRQAKGLKNLGHTVSIIVCDDLPDEEKEGIHIYSTHYKPKNRWYRFLFTKRLVLRLSDKINADIYQVQDPEHISMVRHFRKREKRAIFNMREYYPDNLTNKAYIPKMFRGYIKKRFEGLMKRFFPQYVAVITVTPRIVNILSDQFKFNNVYLIPNYPIPNIDFELTKDEYMNRENVVLYEGTIYRISRQENVLNAIKDIPDVKYLLVGKIDEGYEEIKTHSEWKKTEFINGFKIEDLPAYFRRSTISNTLRDFGDKDGSLGVIKIFESMEAALPVILSDVPIYRKIVEEYNCGVLANPNDVQSIRNAITYLVENKEVAFLMGQNGRRAVLEKFNFWKQLEIYNNLLQTQVSTSWKGGRSD